MKFIEAKKEQAIKLKNAKAFQALRQELDELQNHSIETAVEEKTIEKPNIPESLVTPFTTTTPTSTATDAIGKAIDSNHNSNSSSHGQIKPKDMILNNKSLDTHSDELFSIHYQTIQGAVKGLMPQTVILAATSSLKHLKHLIAINLNIQLNNKDNDSSLSLPSNNMKPTTVKVSIGLSNVLEIKLDSNMSCIDFKNCIIEHINQFYSIVPLQMAVIPTIEDMHYMFIHGHDFSHCDSILPLLKYINQQQQQHLQQQQCNNNNAKDNLILTVHGPNCLPIDNLSSWNIFVQAGVKGSKLQGQSLLTIPLV